MGYKDEIVPLETSSMGIVVSFVSNKGGVGKSTLARALAVEAARGGTRVLLADVDEGQHTSLKWNARRLEARLTPEIEVRAYERGPEGAAADQALADADSCEMLIIDAGPRARAETRTILEASHLIVLPTGVAADDREPMLELIEDIKHVGIDPRRMVVVMCRSESPAQAALTVAAVKKTGVSVILTPILSVAGYAQAMNKGAAITETDWESYNAPARQVLKALVKRLAEVVDAQDIPQQSTRRKGSRAQ
jgi:chromosome partitioning protein